MIVTRYWSIGLLPGFGACHVAVRVSVLPEGSPAGQLAVTPVGAEGGIVAGDVFILIGVDAGLDPPMVVLTIVI